MENVIMNVGICVHLFTQTFYIFVTTEDWKEFQKGMCFYSPVDS